MKTIGLIGGMSWESSLEYYRIINETVKERLGGLHSCKSVMVSVDFAEIEKLQHQGDWGQLAEIMTDAARSLEKAGADFIVICTNTMHKLAENIQQQVKKPVLHIADPTAEKIKAAGILKVGLLGTRFTMEQDFYKKRLQDLHRIHVIIPSEEERQKIHEIIYHELLCGVVKESSKNEFRRIIQNLEKSGAEAVILGCTEIFLVVKPEDYRIKIYDTTAIHAEAAVDLALKKL
ncbi:MAG: aspartate/glutamate racemase family protein [Clostridia bacterium]|nr:aspartate/glutamate racemase family protein [Clostridia bacterium]